LRGRAVDTIDVPHSGWVGRSFCAAALVVTAGVSVTSAQDTCSAADRPSIGVAVGRSSPSFDLQRDAVDVPLSTSILVRGGPQFSVRGDLSIAGPWRLRAEGWTARWNVEGRTYDPVNGQVTSSQSLGEIAVRQIGAAAGLSLGRAPVCARVLFGGGLYTLTFRDQTLRRPGFAFTAGIDIPTGDRGRVQIDVQLHIIETQNRPPVNGSAALAAALVAGWAYRF
jgi:hypothetical protein